MKKLFFFMVVILWCFLLAFSPAWCRPLLLEPRAEYEKNIRAVSEGPSTTRYYYNETLLKEVFGRKSDITGGAGEAKVVWQDKGTRWERIDYEKGTETGRMIIYKKGINGSGQLVGKKLDDIFSQKYIFDRGWDFGDKKILARIIGEGHFLQILVLHEATRTILQEIILSDPERDISSIQLLEDAMEGRKLVVHLSFEKGPHPSGTLYSIDIEGGKSEIIKTNVTEAHLSPSRSAIGFWIQDGAQGTAAFYNIIRGEMICSDVMKGRTLKDVRWSYDERFLSLIIGDGHTMSLLRLDALKRKYNEYCSDSLSISSSPSGRRAVFSRMSSDSGPAFLKSVESQTGKLCFAGKNGEDIVKEARECGTLSQVLLLDLEKKKEEKLCQGIYPDFLSACWSDNEEHIYYFDVKDIYGISAGKKGGKAEKVAECPRYNTGLARGALQPLGRGQFYLLQDGVIYLVRGFKSKDALVDNARLYKLNDSGTLVAFLSEKAGAFNLYTMNLKNREQLPLILGRRQIESFQWRPRTVQVLEVVIDPENVLSDEPVVVQFDEKGDIVPLTSGK
jgi:hypothetical protein